jgi:hypothetical protein
MRPECFRLILACIVLYALGCWVQTCGGEQVRGAGNTDGGVAMVEDDPPESWSTDGIDAGTIDRPMPRKAFDGQKKAPCTKGREREMLGACWLPLEGPPGEDLCGVYFLSEGRCYAPVMQAQRPPSSIEL